MKRSSLHKILSFSLFVSLIIGFNACESEEEKEKTFEEQYPVEDDQKVEYNNEYLKVVDKDEEQKKEKRPKRLINDNAVLNLGQIVFEWGEDTKKVHSFQKKGTDLHFYKKGVRMRIKDMYDFKINLQLFHEKDPFGTAGKNFHIGEKPNNNALLSLEDNWEIGSLELKPTQGKFKIQKLLASTGEVEIYFEGTAKDLISEVEKPFSISIEMRFEEVTSSIAPNS